MIHRNVTADTLGFVRAWVFGLWLIIIAIDPYYLLGEFPRSTLEPIGMLRLLPYSAWSSVINETTLIIHKALTLALVAAAMLGLRPYHVIALAASVLLAFHQTLIRFMGFFNHSELFLLYCAVILAIFPAADGFAWGRWRSRPDNPKPIYAATLLLMASLGTMAYVNISAFRLAFATPEIFIRPTMDVWLARHVRFNTLWGYEIGIWCLNHPPVMAVIRIGYFVTTIFEVLSPLCLFWRRFRYLWFIVIVPFHFSTWFLMGIFFWHNLLLMPVLLVDIGSFFTAKPVAGGKPPVIFFDGVCGLCNRFVDWVIARDTLRIFRYATLQGATAAEAGVVDTSSAPTGWTIVLKDEDGTWSRSDAVLRIIARIGWLYGFAEILQFCPRSIRDAVYKLVARYRYRIFGKKEACRLPSQSEYELFLE